MNAQLFSHLVAVLLAVLALWSLRHELSERAVTVFDRWVPALFAILAAAVLLIVSPGKRFELWLIAVGAGLLGGLAMGVTLQGAKDFGNNLVRVYRAWDGVGAAAALILLAVVRLVTSDFTGRQSGGYGVLGALAALLAAYLVGRVITFQFYTAPRTIHLDMFRGQKRQRTDI
jgi:hypothetical protein